MIGFSTWYDLIFLRKKHCGCAQDLEAVRPRAILDLIHSAENFRIELGAAGHIPQPRTCQRCGYICSQVRRRAALRSTGRANPGALPQGCRARVLLSLKSLECTTAVGTVRSTCLVALAERRGVPRFRTT